MTTETKEYAQLAAFVYKTTDANKLEVPLGWAQLDLIPDLSDGFSAGVFRRIGTTEIVIAYTGTNANKITDTAFGNLPAGTGQPSSQVLKAMLLYERIKNTPGYGDNISFTGHSLGGGLASLMAVYFNKPATTFDAAPFQISALNSSTLNYYKNELASRGYVDENFNQYNDATYPLSPSTFSAREANVTGYHLQGEFLNPTRNDLTTIYGGAENEIKTGPTALSAFQLHSMTLLSATQWSTSFASAIQTNSTVLNLVFDKNLYFKDDETDPQANFLNLALSSEVKANGTGSQGMLTHFATDLNKLGTNLAGLSDAAQKALIAQGIEWYYWQSTNYAGKEFFTQTGELLQYTVNSGNTASLKPEANKALKYTSAWLDPMVQAEGGYSVAYKYDQWNVAAGSSGVSATALDATKSQRFIGGAGADSFTGGNEGDLLMGGAGIDTLTGGAGMDNLFGGAGDDVLDGGSGGDWLYGGAGSDTYQLKSGELFDVIQDSDGNGKITVNGTQLTGGKKADDNYWISADKQWGYLLTSGGDLVISKGSSLDTITIRNWQSNGGNQLGIVLDNAQAPVDPKTGIWIFTGDQHAQLNASGYYKWGETSWAPTAPSPQAWPRPTLPMSSAAPQALTKSRAWAATTH